MLIKNHCSNSYSPGWRKFDVSRGVEQGFVLAPTLFKIFFSVLLCFAFLESSGILLHLHSGAELFNLNRLRAKTKVRRMLVRERLYAMTQLWSLRLLKRCRTSATHLQLLAPSSAYFNQARKALLFYQNVPTRIHYSALSTVDKFCYLGSVVTNTNYWGGRESCTDRAISNSFLSTALMSVE